MNMNSLEAFKKSIKEEEIPSLDKEKTISYIRNHKKERKGIKIRPRQIMIVASLSVLLISGIVFGEEITTQLKKVFQIKDESGNVEYEYSKMDEPKGAALLPEVLSKSELNAINNYRSKVEKAIEPGSIAFFIDLNTIEKLDMLHGVSRFKEFDTFKKLESSIKNSSLKSFGEGKHGYEFTKGSVLYKADEESYKNETREDFIKRLTKKAKSEGSRFAYEQYKMTDEAEIICLIYSDSEYNRLEFTINEIDELGYKLESSVFAPEKIKKIQIDSREAIIEYEPYLRVHFIIDNKIYFLHPSGNVTEEEIVEIIKLLGE